MVRNKPELHLACPESQPYNRKVSSDQLTGEFSLVTVLVLPRFDFSLMFLCLTIKDIMCSLIKLLPNCMLRFNLALMKVNLFHEKVQV